jgi:hypothetical protein
MHEEISKYKYLAGKLEREKRLVADERIILKRELGVRGL